MKAYIELDFTRNGETENDIGTFEVTHKSKSLPELRVDLSAIRKKFFDEYNGKNLDFPSDAFIEIIESYGYSIEMLVPHITMNVYK